MKRLLLAPLALIVASGCANGGLLRPLTGRLDLVNQQLTSVNGQLREANQRLGDAQAKLAQTNERLDGALGRLDETNRKLNVVDQAILKFPGLRPPGAPAPAEAAPPAR